MLNKTVEHHGDLRMNFRPLSFAEKIAAVDFLKDA
jgi:hypothetical protein